MKEYINELLEKYQVRKTDKQKVAFIAWLRKTTEKFGYDLEIDKYNEHGRNLVFGDVKNSKVILTAHYDTQPNGIIPRISFMTNPIIYLLSEIFSYGIILLIFILIRFTLAKFLEPSLANTISGVLLIGYIFQLFVGFANKYTANDNSSGVSTLLSIMEELEEPYREKVCFVFFDHEELGLLGSKNFKNKYYKVVNEKPLINFDCVANGEYMFFVTKKEFRNSRLNGVLEQAVKEEFKVQERVTPLIEPSTKIIFTSDQIWYKNGIAVTAMKKIPVLGYYLDRIHSPLDTVFQEGNIKLLKNTMINFIKNI